MPMVPSLNTFSAQTASQNQAQPSPNPSNPRRSPPPGQIQRLLPTPPQPNPPGFGDDRRPTPPPGPHQSISQPNIHSHYPRQAPRAPGTAYPTPKFQDLDSPFQMTDELLADIDRAHQLSTQPNSYSSAPRGDSPSSLKAPNRGPADRASPTNLDPAQRMRREQTVSRESPKARDRQSGSPTFSPYPQQSHTPEPATSTNQQPQPSTVIPNEPHPASYLAQYNARESPPVVRRATINEGRSNPGQTAPAQAIPARNPDRSLPVQEEDEVSSKNGTSPPSNWNDEPAYRSPSPKPSSDLSPEGNNQRFESNPPPDNQPGVMDEEKAAAHHDEPHAQYVEHDSTEEESSYTPRSPSAGLPDNHEIYYSGQNIPIRVPVPVPVRGKMRNGSTEHVMRGLESTLMEASTTAAPPQQSQPSERPPQYPEPRQPPAQRNPHQFPGYPNSDDYAYAHDHQQNQNAKFTEPQVYPDDFHSYGEESTSAYIHPYYQQNPRPDAPEPPTPHTQTAAPSPSPQLSGFNGGGPKELPYRPLRAAGSPYPYPFNHMRRNRQMQTPGQRFYKNGIDQSGLHDQIARQWQVFAQNNQGHITDSTLSPSATPFQPDLFDHWAYLHTNRMMRGGAMFDNASIHSSPSHQPIALPVPPNFSTKKKDRSLHLKRQSYSRKPPPRVESTQPRETSPELSSSGEETAGDERLNSAVGPPSGESLVHPPPSTTDVATEADDNGDWVDEDEDDDYEDLIDLEYHPAFVKNISKRRRKWEVGWENLIQAFQALDRQTDATMVLLASPSHTTKLHALRSRSIRRQPILASSVNMNQIRSGFAHMAAQRRATRPEKSSLVDRLMISSGSSGGDGSDGSTASVEENLRRALDAALGSLGAMGEVYEQREARVLEELQRSREDRERVELLLKQVLGDKNPLTALSPRIPAP